MIVAPPLIVPPGLVEHGLYTEKCDYRIHVGVGSGRIYVFKRTDAIEALEEYHKQFPAKRKYLETRQGDYGVCALSFLLPINRLQKLSVVQWPDFPLRPKMKRGDSTANLGAMASATVTQGLEQGRILIPGLEFPYEIVDFLNDKEMQNHGIDAMLIDQNGTETTIEDKCDFLAGPDGVRWGDEVCRGNLCLQIYEKHPGRTGQWEEWKPWEQS